MVLDRFGELLLVCCNLVLISAVTMLLQPLALIAGKQRLRFDLRSGSIFLIQLIGVGGLGKLGILERFECGRDRSIQELKQLDLQAVCVALLLARLIEVILWHAIPKATAAQ